MLPSKNRAQRWAYWAQKATSWLTISTDTPLAVSADRMAAKLCLKAASSPLVGSSSSRISGRCSSTLASAARCCSPPDRS